MEHPTDAMRRTIAEQHDEIAALRAENAKLRDGAYAMRQLYEDELKHALGENAKLRELVRTFYHCTTSGECDECSINGGGPVRLMPDTICDTIHDRMRELGVEV